MQPASPIDTAAIEELVRAMFAAFDSTEAAGGSLDRLPSLFTPDARITVLDGAGEVHVHTVPDFIRPRRALLLGGGLTDFRERETDGETLLGRDVACRRSRYTKSGVRDGQPFTGGGTKVFSFVRVKGAWKILGFLWQDD